MNKVKFSKKESKQRKLNFDKSAEKIIGETIIDEGLYEIESTKSLLTGGHTGKMTCNC